MKKALLWKESFFSRILLRLHPGPSRRSRTTQAPGALSQGEYACGGTPLAICAAAMASRHSHTVLPHPAAEFSWLACFASQSPLHGCAMLSPLCTRGASLCPGKHNRPRQRKYGRPATGPRIAGWPLPVLARQHRSMEAQQRIPTGDRNGCGATPPQMRYDNVIRLSLKWTFSTGTWMPSR